jgi:hypothetical protein
MGKFTVGRTSVGKFLKAAVFTLVAALVAPPAGEARIWTPPRPPERKINLPCLTFPGYYTFLEVGNPSAHFWILKGTPILFYGQARECRPLHRDNACAQRHSSASFRNAFSPAGARPQRGLHSVVDRASDATCSIAFGTAARDAVQGDVMGGSMSLGEILFLVLVG